MIEAKRSGSGNVGCAAGSVLRTKSSHALTKRLALLYVVPRKVEGHLHNSHRAYSQNQALTGQLLHQLHKTHAFGRTEQVGFRHPHVAEKQL